MSHGLLDPELMEPTTLGPPSEDDISEDEISEDDLAALALACPVDQPPDPAAEADRLLLRQGPLPLAYMPPTASGRRNRGLAVIALLLIAAFLTITALGFCITYGSLVFA